MPSPCQGCILRFNGKTFTHLPGTACYRCFFKEPPPAGAVPTCSQAGVLGGIGELLTNRLLSFDAKTMQFRTIKVKQRPTCAICGEHPTIRYAILSLHEGVHLNSFKILNGEVVDKEVHL